jgi:hypothetical protein
MSSSGRGATPSRSSANVQLRSRGVSFDPLLRCQAVSYAHAVDAAKARAEIERHLWEATKEIFARTGPVRAVIELSSSQLVAELGTGGSSILHVGNARADKQMKTYVLHEQGIDLLGLAGDAGSPRVQRRCAGPQWGLDYREEMTVDYTSGGTVRVEAIIDAPVFDKPVRCEIPRGNDDFDEARRVLLEWARGSKG